MSRLIRVLLSCFVCAAAEAKAPSTPQDPIGAEPITPAVKSELETCVAQAGQAAGDDQERRIVVGVFIGPQGRAVNLAVLESSGLEHLDRLILQCVFRAHYSPATLGESPIQWFFRCLIHPRRDA